MHSPSTRYSRMSMPSVMYLMMVSGPVQSSKRTVYPTCIMWGVDV